MGGRCGGAQAPSTAHPQPEVSETAEPPQNRQNGPLRGTRDTTGATQPAELATCLLVSIDQEVEP